MELYTNPRLVRYVASGMCGIHASALTYVSERFYIELDDHHVRSLSLPVLLQRIYQAFDADDGEDEGSDANSSSEEDDEPPPKRPRRERQQVERFGEFAPSDEREEMMEEGVRFQIYSGGATAPTQHTKQNSFSRTLPRGCFHSSFSSSDHPRPSELKSYSPSSSLNQRVLLNPPHMLGGRHMMSDSQWAGTRPMHTTLPWSS